MVAQSKGLEEQAVILDRLADLPGRDQLEGLLRGNGYDFHSFALRVMELTGQPSSGDQVKRTFAGTRDHDHVKEALALEFELPREEVDRLLADRRTTAAGGTR